MKLLIILLFALGSCFLEASAQVAPIYFYGDSIIKEKEYATSYAIYGKLSEEELWVFKRFDLYNNLIQTGSYKDEKLSVPHGKFDFYSDIYEFNSAHLTSFNLKGLTRFLSQTGTFVDGKEEGRWQLFYPDGTLLNRQDFVKGKQHGEFVTYDKRGRVQIQGNFVDGERDGKWIFKGGAQEIIYDKGKVISSYNVKKAKRVKGMVKQN